MFQSFKGIWQSLFIFKDFLINLFIIIDRFFFRGEINLKNFIYLPGPMSFRDAHRWFSIEITSYLILIFFELCQSPWMLHKLEANIVPGLSVLKLRETS